MRQLIALGDKRRKPAPFAMWAWRPANQRLVGGARGLRLEVTTFLVVFSHVGTFSLQGGKLLSPKAD